MEDELNTQFSYKVLMPGFVEGHCHAMEGQAWNHTYVGFFDRTDPDGNLHQELKNMEQVVERIQQTEHAMKNPETPLFAWGFDPIYYQSDRMSVKHLDAVQLNAA